MQVVTSFPASAIPRDQLSRILADYLALDRARIIRRLLVSRCGVLALVAAVLGTVFHGFYSFARWFMLGPFLLPPMLAWISELRLERRLSRRLKGVEGPVTYKSEPPSRIRGTRHIRKS